MLKLPKLDPAKMPFLAKWDASRYSPLYLAWGYPEEKVQGEIVETMAGFDVTLWPVEAGAKQARAQVQRALHAVGAHDLARTAGNAKGLSTLPSGHSDLSGCLAPTGRAIYLEVKRPALYISGVIARPAGTADQDQLAFLLARHYEGAIVAVVWSLADALEILEPHLGAHRKAIRGVRRGAALV